MHGCRWWVDCGPTLRNGVGAIVLFGVDVWFNVFFRVPEPPMPGTLLFLMGSTLPLTWRRCKPVPVFVVVATVALTGTVLGMGISGAGTLMAIYSVAAWQSRNAALWCLACFAVAKIPAEVLAGTALTWLPVLSVLYYTAYVLGDQQRCRRVLVDQLKDKTVELEREREARVRLATVAERAEIARELHDVVAHTVSIMVLYTSVARRALARDPASADTALEQVEASGRQSLTELRRLLGVLRTDSPANLTPQASMADLDGLLGRFAAAGLPLRAEISGDRRVLPAGAELCAYRIVQEALTNVTKHSEPTEVTVAIEYAATELRIDVRNDEPRPAGPVPGHGLIGMRERAALIGGDLEVIHHPHEFRIVAKLPYRG